MKSFQFSPEQIAAIVAALSAEELVWRFGRQFDSQKIAMWNADASFREGEMALDEEKLHACIARSLSFFGQAEADADALLPQTNKIGDLARAIQSRIETTLTHMNFQPAAPDKDEGARRHEAAVVFSDGAALARLLYGRRRIAYLVSPHSLLGFTAAILVPNLLHVDAVDLRGVAPSEISQSLQFGDAVVATPTQWRYLISEGLTAPDNAIAVYFGEAMNVDIAMEMRKAGFGAHREVYGSTEDGLIGWRDSSAQDFALFDFWRRDGEALVRILPCGREQRTTPMDILEFSGENLFTLGGRRDGAVQVGAINVFPAAIAAVIEKHPAIARCVVDVAKSEKSGNRIIAQIELAKPGTPPESLAREIDAWCRANLRPFERPRIYNFLGVSDSA